jgi:hypothetical protein
MAAANSDSVAPARSAAGRSIIVREHDPQPTTPPLKINPAAKVRAKSVPNLPLGATSLGAKPMLAVVTITISVFCMN